MNVTVHSLTMFIMVLLTRGTENGTESGTERKTQKYYDVYRLIIV